MPVRRSYIDEGVFAGRRVLLTGHTGFKGAWLAIWLSRLGAKVTGVALAPTDDAPLFRLANVESVLDHRVADINDPMALSNALRGVDAEVVIHLAAQSLVRESYESPAATFQTNVTGTANVLDCVRRMPSAKAVVIATSDKCYENHDWHWGYRETDRLGGSDPYSASKAATELVAQAYARSFFSTPGGAVVATGRAGNVFGGGDFARDRLVPDIARAAENGSDMLIRQPQSVRPWQHVLEPLHGYLTLAAALLREGHCMTGAFNFGPDPSGVIEVGGFVEQILGVWGEGAPKVAIGDPAETGADTLKEARFLTLDSSKAHQVIGWEPQLTIDEAIDKTVSWYKTWLAGGNVAALTRAQIEAFETRVRRMPIRLAG